MKKRKRISKRAIGQGLAYGGMGLLLLLALILINPSVGDSSYATCLDGVGGNECAVSALTQEVGVTTKTAISLATASEVKLPDVTPTSAGTTSYASTKLAVSTNSKEGYSIFLQAGTADGSLVGVTSSMDDTSKITNTEKTGTLLSNLETNAYGYALSTVDINENTTYSHVPTSSTVIYNKSNNTEMGDGTGDYPYGDEYYLAFGTKIGTSLPAGTYAGTVTVSAVANPLTVTSLYDISMMQEMTSSICENTKEGYTKQLIDTRDGKSYWVAKLKDGNCWMTQNLALDIGIDDHGNAAAVAKDGSKITLASSNTDITASWTTSSQYPPKETNLLHPGSIPANYSYSWSAKYTLMVLPDYNKICSPDSDLSKSLPSDLPTLCDLSGALDVSGNLWSPTYIAQNSTWTFIDGTKYTGRVAADADTRTYDSHYLIGNYYQYGAATAGTGISQTNGDSAASICSKGWKLPSSQETASLLQSYNSPITELYLTRSGSVDLGMGHVFPGSFGTEGNLWTASVLSANNANRAYIGRGVGIMSGGKYYGLSVRCLAR